MHRRLVPQRRPWLLTASVSVLLAACSPADDEHAEVEVAGVVLEREAPIDGDAPPEAPVGRPDDGIDGSDDGIEGLVLLRSGPTVGGTLFVAAEGEWVGLDGQTLQSGQQRPLAHLHAVVETDADGTWLRGCEVRLVAPDDAELRADGVFSVDAVVERRSGEESRTGLDLAEIDLVVAPGGESVLTLTVPGSGPVELDVDRDAQARCEGRFDRT